MKIVNPADVEPVVATDRPLFTGGEVKARFLLGRDDAKELGIGIMSFGPGGRTKMHTHTSEQILYITEGKGMVGTEDEEVVVTPGMVVFFPAGEKHFHGATADTPVSHLTIAPPHKTEF
ncbi:cupin domain-containing protein [Chloroflexota bacterium]